MADLSVVWASRDDDYANGVNDRLVRSIESVQTSARDLSLELDLIVVDWNSPGGRGLRGLLESKGVKRVRIIEVPSEVVAKHPNQTGRKFEEYLAKNIGVRRAEAEQIAVINSDVVLSKELLGMCVDRVFINESFLRADRLDVSNRNGRLAKRLRLHVRHGESPGDKITVRPKSFFKFLTGSSALRGESNYGPLIVGPPGGIADHFLLGMHSNASGDFLASSKENWFSANGFSEDNWVTTMGDSLMVARFTSLNLRQAIAPGPRHLFHEDHPSDPTRGGAWSEEMWPDFLDQLISVAKGSWNSASEISFGLDDLELNEFRL